MPKVNLALTSDMHCNHYKGSCSLNITTRICNINFCPVYHATAFLIRVQEMIALTALFYLSGFAIRFVF